MPRKQMIVRSRVEVGKLAFCLVSESKKEGSE